MKLLPDEIIILENGQENLIENSYPDRIIKTITRPEIHAFIVSNPKANVLVLMGGGYLQLMYDSEGVEIANWLNEKGFNAYILVHRLPNDTGGSDIALKDGVLALEFLKAKTAPIFICGLSSGGHLSGVLACQDYDIKGAIIAYAPINANHKDYKYPVGKPDFPPKEKQDFYNDWPIGIFNEKHGIPKCPVFLCYALHDNIVPIEHALNFIKTARDLSLNLDAHIFTDAPHGFCLRHLDGSQASWPELAEKWIQAKL